MQESELGPDNPSIGDCRIIGRVLLSFGDESFEERLGVVGPFETVEEAFKETKKKDVRSAGIVVRQRRGYPANPAWIDAEEIYTEGPGGLDGRVAAQSSGTRR